MSALPDLSESHLQALQKHALTMLIAVERGQPVPWTRPDGSMDEFLIALLARGIQTLSQSHQESFFHRLGEAMEQKSTPRDRRGALLLYHSTEMLNAASHAIAHPKTDAERDSRLQDVPSSDITDVRKIVAQALIQHARDIPDDPHALAQDALILYMRDSAKGIGISDADLIGAILSAQAYYFDTPDVMTQPRDPRLDAVRHATLDMATLRDFVIESRYSERFMAPPAPDDPQGRETPSDQSPASDQDASAAPGASADATAEDKVASPDSNNGTQDVPTDPTDANSGSSAPDGHGEEPPPYPDDAWTPESMDQTSDDAAPSPFNDQVLGSNASEHQRGDWPTDQRDASRHRKPQRQQKAHTAANPSGRAERTNRQGWSDPSQNAAPSASPVTQNGAAPTIQENITQGGAMVRGPGLFSGLANGLANGLAGGLGLAGGVTAGTVSSLFRKRGAVPSLHEQMQIIHDRSADIRAQQQKQIAAQQKWRSADRFVDNLNAHIDLFRHQEPIQDMLRRVHEDQQQRAQAVQDGADPHLQQKRHIEWANRAWEQVLSGNPKLRSALSRLESDAEQLPELVNPALSAMDQSDADMRGEQEALLAKMERAQKNSQGLPPSVPGTSSLGERIAGVFGAIKRFLARLFGYTEAATASTVSASPAGPAQPSLEGGAARRRSGP